jgi:predicted ABC-type ATPase
LKEKTIYIIAGCNGAGKTTASFTILPEILDCKVFVNADEIAKGLSPFQPEKVAFEAGRIMLERIESLLNSNISFAFETTLATKIYKSKLENAILNGYNIKLLFFWLPSVEMAINRVAIRVSEGGHNIPEEVIRRRYFRGVYNLTNKFIDICDYWIVIDNSAFPYKFIAEGSLDFPITIYENDIWEKIKMMNNEK